MTEPRTVVPVPVQRQGTHDAAALLAAADAEADAFADRLHDGALQALVVARYAADAAVRGGDPVLARDAVQEALVVLRRAVAELRPRGEHDLPAALAELSSRRAAAGMPVLSLDLDADVAGRMSPPARALAYRFVQAAASPGAAARVAVRGDEHGVVVSVDGAPADVAGWAARAAAVGGRLDHRGAESRLLLPLPDSEPEGDV